MKVNVKKFVFDGIIIWCHNTFQSYGYLTYPFCPLSTNYITLSIFLILSIVDRFILLILVLSIFFKLKLTTMKAFLTLLICLLSIKLLNAQTSDKEEEICRLEKHWTVLLDKMTLQL